MAKFVIVMDGEYVIDTTYDSLKKAQQYVTDLLEDDTDCIQYTICEAVEVARPKRTQIDWEYTNKERK